MSTSEKTLLTVSLVVVLLMGWLLISIASMVGYSVDGELSVTGETSSVESSNSGPYMETSVTILQPGNVPPNGVEASVVVAK